MSLDIDRINGLLRIVREAAMHPAKLAPIGTLAMKELEEHSVNAKKEHDKFLAEQAKEAEAKKADAEAKAKKLAEEEAKKTELTSKPQPVAKPAESFKREEPISEDQPETFKRREVPEEVNHG